MNTFPPPAPAAPAGHQKPSGRTIGIFAAVAVVAAGGTFLVTRGDDPKTVAPVGTTTTVAVTAPTNTTAPVTIAPSTTVAETAPPSTVPATVVIPDGATELGYGVYIPAMEGVEVTGDGPFTFSSGDGRRSIAQVLNRDYSEDPNDLLQEYIDTWDADYDSVNYSMSTVFDPGHLGHPNLRLARVFYSIHVPSPDADVDNIGGSVWAVVRDDGLSLLVDQWGTGSEGLLAPVYDEVIASLTNAPAVGEPHEFADAISKLPPNNRPTAEMPFTCNCRVALAPGYTVTASTATVVTVANGNSQMFFQRIDGVPSADQAQQTAVQLVHGLTPSASIDAIEVVERELPNYFASWNDNGGSGAYGAVWFMYDESAQAMLIAISSNFGPLGDNNAQAFMVDGFAWQQWTLA